MFCDICHHTNSNSNTYLNAISHNNQYIGEERFCLEIISVKCSIHMILLDNKLRFLKKMFSVYLFKKFCILNFVETLVSPTLPRVTLLSLTTSELKSFVWDNESSMVCLKTVTIIKIGKCYIYVYFQLVANYLPNILNCIQY